ncbi:MAG: mycoredoxin [Mycobacteriales bacterium]
MTDAPALTMFTTTWCGYCKQLKRLMDRDKIAYAEVNIETDELAAVTVERANDGNQTVPTLLFPDGSTMTNPSIDAVRAKLAA